eukprot:9190085-Alexandrium_andersonii.AAC.1
MPQPQLQASPAKPKAKQGKVEQPKAEQPKAEQKGPKRKLKLRKPGEAVKPSKGGTGQSQGAEKEVQGQIKLATAVRSKYLTLE